MKEACIRKKYVYEQTDHSKNTPSSTDSVDETISSLMVKYGLSLYQIRELRKKHG